MPVIIKAAVWNVQTEIAGANNMRAGENFTSLLKWQDKVKLLRAVVELADGALPVPADLPTGTHALRLFLAPEYLFSESCTQHVIDYETRCHVVESLANLSADMPQMLLMPGTVAYFKPLVDKKLESRRFKANTNHESRVVKYAGCFKVGEEKSTYLAHNTAYAFFGGKQAFKYRKMLDASELNAKDKEVGKVVVFSKGQQLGVFDFDKAGQRLRIGVEICADHDSGVLHNGNVRGLDLQIVLSASTGLRPNFSVVRDGGCLFQCDSKATSADGKGRAFQSVRGTLVDLRDTAAQVPAAAERIDPLARPDFGKKLQSKTTKLDEAYKKVHEKAVANAPSKQAGDAAVQKEMTRYLAARGGTLHFYEVTIP